jgi:hypothetical protein
MILVWRAGCDAVRSVRGYGARIEVIRFSLLVVLTVGLVSIAFRINSSPSSSSSHPQPSRPVPSPATSSLAPVQPSVAPTHAIRIRPPGSGPARGSGAGSGAGTGTGTGTGAGIGTGTGTGTGGQQQLPVTGWDDAAKLAAVAFLLIGGGTLAMRAAGPRQRAGETVQD